MFITKPESTRSQEIPIPVIETFLCPFTSGCCGGRGGGNSCCCRGDGASRWEMGWVMPWGVGAGGGEGVAGPGRPMYPG